MPSAAKHQQMPIKDISVLHLGGGQVKPAHGRFDYPYHDYVDDRAGCLPADVRRALPDVEKLLDECAALHDCDTCRVRRTCEDQYIKKGTAWIPRRRLARQ